MISFLTTWIKPNFSMFAPICKSELGCAEGKFFSLGFFIEGGVEWMTSPFLVRHGISSKNSSHGQDTLRINKLKPNSKVKLLAD